MRFARTRLPLALIVTLLAMGSAAAAPASAATVGHVFPALDSAASISSQTASRNEYVILQAWQTDRLRSLKAANPSLNVLVYKNLAFSAQLSSSHVGPAPSGVSYGEAPDSWFLKNTGGSRFTSDHYSWLWAMDVGSAAYQQRWTDNVLAELESEDWDGVFLDDASATMKYQYNPSKIAMYPNDSSYSAAMGSALAYVGPRIRAAGKLAVPNFASWVEYPSTYNGWLQHVSGALDEMFLKWGRGTGEGYRSEGQWTTQLNEVKYAASQGKAFLAFTQGSVGETQASRYGYATLMLASNGNASYAFTPNYTSESWLPEFDYDLGAPLGDETRDSSGVHRRGFQQGLVLVNPTDSARSVDFGGTYSGSGLSDATGATMAPHSALVLTGPPPSPAVSEAVPASEPASAPAPAPNPAPTSKARPTSTPAASTEPARPPATTTPAQQGGGKGKRVRRKGKAHRHARASRIARLSQAASRRS